MTPTISRSRWWRWLAPVNFLTALAVFLLPWVEVRCDKAAVQPRVQAPDASGVRIWAAGTSQQSEWETVVTQSGLQAVYGGYSEAAGASYRSGSQDREAFDIPVAPWIGVYAGLLILAAAAGLLLRTFRRRCIAGLAFGGAAVVVLLVQGLVGFPIEEVFLKEGESSSPARALVEVRYTPWYYLSFALLWGGMAAAALDRPGHQRPLGGYERENGPCWRP
jgi:hypothetical protein